MGREAGLGLFLVPSGPTRRGPPEAEEPEGDVGAPGRVRAPLGWNHPFSKQGGALQVISRSILFLRLRKLDL